MSRYISNIIRNKLFSNNVIQLGRWKIDYCDKKINRKIDMANDDHCGPCGLTIIDKNNIILNTVDLIKSDNIIIEK